MVTTSTLANSTRNNKCIYIYIILYYMTIMRQNVRFDVCLEGLSTGLKHQRTGKKLEL